MFVRDLTIYPNRMEEKDYREQEDIYSKVLRAGRRTYFFDVRATRAEDYYLTITESKKFTNEDGSFHYKKHKIYLYKEDFAGFQDLLHETTQYILQEKGESVIEGKKEPSDLLPKEPQTPERRATVSDEDKFTNVNFDDI